MPRNSTATISFSPCLAASLVTCFFQTVASHRYYDGRKKGEKNRDEGISRFDAKYKTRFHVRVYTGARLLVRSPILRLVFEQTNAFFFPVTWIMFHGAQ